MNDLMYPGKDEKVIFGFTNGVHQFSYSGPTLVD